MKIYRLNRFAALLLCTSALATPALAQEAGAPDTEEGDAIVVTGVRGSQMRSVELKRDAAGIIDAISAEDIGKLPDVTISDSLQRISGIQVQRSAGEGATVNIRGLPQVVTLLNGEQYLSPANLGTAQPNLNDIPAQLVNGVTVYKSQDVRNALSGISGTIDIKTRRPFDFASGLTLSGQAEYQRGTSTKNNDYLVSGLASWRNDTVGLLLGASYSQSTLGNNYAGWGGGVFGNNDWGQTSTLGSWIAPHGYETFHREVERNRLGLNGSVQFELGGGLTLTGEGFYTKLVEHDLKAGMNISNRWTGLGWTTPTAYEATSVNHWTGTPWLAVDEYDLDAWWVNSFSVNRSVHSNSKDFNLELKYDEDGPFTARLRGVYADADYLNTNGQVQGDLSNWQYYPDRTFTLFRNGADRTRGPFYPASVAQQYSGQYSNGVVGSAGGRYVTPNPQGYAGDPQLHLDISKWDMRWSGFNTPMPTTGGLGAGKSLADYMANLDSYTVGAYSSEGNNHNTSDLWAIRGDASYDFANGTDGGLFGLFQRLDFGSRMSQRKTSISVYHLFSRLYAGQNASDPQGCAVQWKAIDVVLDNTAGCTAGEQVANPSYDSSQPVSATNPLTVFQGYTAWRPTLLKTNNNTYFLTDFGSQTQGFPGVWVADPRDFNDPVAFQTNVFGNAYPVIIPGSSYDVNFREWSNYANLAVETGPLRGELGLRAVRTQIKVRQNLTGATIPYGDTNLDVGDYFAGRTYWDWLPTANFQFDITDDIKLRASFAKTMIPLDLGNYGGGLTIATNDAQCDPLLRQPTDAPCGVRQVTSASSGGNPNLDPWRANNYDASLEYYIGRASMLSAAYFKLDIDSFVTTQTLTDGQFADGDGVIRRTVPYTRPIQGRGGKMQGFELGAKLAFSDLTQAAFIRNLGIDANFTFSDSKQTQGSQPDGAELPFFDNSKYQTNVVLWYQDEKSQARVAYNRRSPRLSGFGTGFAMFQDTAQYVDVNVTYAVTPQISIYANGSNVLGEIEKYYYRLDASHNQFASSNEFEPRYSLGVRAKF